jgi:hypothetical protein
MTHGNGSQIPRRKRRRQAKTVAMDCDRLRFGAHGEGRVDATSLLLKSSRAFDEIFRAEGIKVIQTPV